MTPPLLTGSLVRAFAAVHGLSRRHHDGNQKTGQLRGRVRVGLVRLDGPQHGGAERSHVAAFEGVRGRPRCLSRAG